MLRRVILVKVKPNEPCWCGSGRKYKKCHREEDQANAALFPDRGRRGSKVGASPGRRVKAGAVSPMRSVPDQIVRPDYARSGRPGTSRRESLIKSPEQIERMRRAGQAGRRVLEVVMAAVKPGVTTDEIDAIAHEAYIREGGYPSPLNYHGYPKSLCTSVNEVICHGIPDDRKLEDGDIVNCDVTIYLDGMHGDCSETVLVGSVDEASKKLVEVTHASLMAGIGAVRSGGLLREVGKAIEETVRPHGYGIVRSFVGHGIGETFHMDPQVAHYYDRSARFKFEPGMTFTIEPMINLGRWEHLMWDDGWTAVTCDYKRSAQFEHTLLVTETGVEILTLAADQEQPFLGR